ncbi:helix-turn-helix domain-containing protein [uncultured Eubacterium sp.]|uniref:helix-turn-helix domain-containing protein n=1 Tax=uncultured Eubacterium sp. TaxID=165185 RepID=UPI0025DD7CB2|nr:helix-turn-helix transcriptional regulator [uncultured Eubacterium sp.]
MKFDENLRAFRKQKELSQEYLAEKMNVSRQTISKWENGTAMPDLKKLTDLASLFDVSMDELLGTSAPDYKTSVSDNAELENLKQAFDEYKAKNKKTTIIFGAVSTVLVVALIVATVNLSNSIANLQSRVNSLPSGQMIYQNDGDDDSSILCDVDCFVSKVDKDNPDKVEMTFTYAPKTYVKGTSVKFVVTDALKSTDPQTTFEAELSGNSFCAVIPIKMSGSNTVNVSVDDGTNVTSEQMDIDWVGEYYGFINQIQYYDIDSTGTNERIIFNENPINWEENSECPKITKAYLEAEDENGKIVYSKKCKIKLSDSVYSVDAESFDSAVKISAVYIKLIDEYGTECRMKCAYLYNDTDGFDSTAESVEATPEAVIRFPNGMKLTTS